MKHLKITERHHSHPQKMDGVNGIKRSFKHRQTINREIQRKKKEKLRRKEVGFKKKSFKLRVKGR